MSCRTLLLHLQNLQTNITPDNIVRDTEWFLSCIITEHLPRLQQCYSSSIYQALICITTHTQPFYGSLDFVRDNQGEPVPEETFTHSHQSWSSVIPYLLPPSITILPVQFTCLTVFFHNLSLSFLLSTSWPGTLNYSIPIIVFFS